MTDEQVTELINAERAKWGRAPLPHMDFRKELRGIRERIKELEKAKADLLDRGDYTLKQGKSRPHASPVERAVVRREKIERELVQKRHMLKCLELLPTKEKSLLYRLYVRREGRVRICADLGITERTLSTRAEKALFTLRYAYYTASKI